MSDDWKPLRICLAEDCRETKDVMIMECAPGETWCYSGGVCGHFGFIHRRPEISREAALAAMRELTVDVPRETSPTE
jgi:hypothetical protein